MPPQILARLRHYFLTYKEGSGQEKRECEITHISDSEEAHKIIKCAQQDYQARFAYFEEMLAKIRTVD